MRTTLTLEPDVAVEIEQRRRARGTSLKQEVNELLRRGLRAGDAPARAPFRTEAADLGEPMMSLDCIGEVLARLDELDRADAAR